MIATVMGHARAESPKGPAYRGVDLKHNGYSRLCLYVDELWQEATQIGGKRFDHVGHGRRARWVKRVSGRFASTALQLLQHLFPSLWTLPTHMALVLLQ